MASAASSEGYGADGAEVEQALAAIKEEAAPGLLVLEERGLAWVVGADAPSRSCCLPPCLSLLLPRVSLLSPREVGAYLQPAARHRQPVLWRHLDI